MRNTIRIAAALITLVLANCSALRERIVLGQMRGVVEDNFKTTLLDDLPDGLHVVLCGAGSPLPDPKRAGACTAVIAGNQLYIVDAGAGASKNLTLFKIPQGKIRGILLTHFHSDHFDGLGELLMQRWVNAPNDAPVPVYGPTGVAQVVDAFNLAYLHDTRNRIAHHGPDLLIPSGAGGTARPFDLPADGALTTVLEHEGLSISALAVDHGPVSPAVAYRFDYRGRSVVISGDTKKSANLQAFSQNVDQLVHEALNPKMVAVITEAARTANNPRVEKITTDILEYHTSPTEAAAIARDASVGFLLFNHVVPPLPVSVMESVFTAGVDDIFEGPYAVGKDGTMVTLEADTKAIVVREAGSLL